MLRTVLTVVLVAVASGGARAQVINGYSGMSRIRFETMVNKVVETRDVAVVVHDRKPFDSGPRLGVVSPNGRYQAISTIEKWPSRLALPSDLEACSSVGNASGRHDFLLAESGFFRGDFGRVFHVAMNQDRNGGWTAEYQGHFQPFRKPTDDYTTPSELQIEGMVTAAHANGAQHVVFGRRGGPDEAGHVHPAQLVWGRLRLSPGAGPAFTPTGSAELPLNLGPQLARARGCSALAWSPETGLFPVCVACTDPDDEGPFHSCAYVAGGFEWEGSPPGLKWHPSGKVVKAYTFDGLKVEALDSILGAENAFVGTDDEDFGGIFRPLDARQLARP